MKIHHFNSQSIADLVNPAYTENMNNSQIDFKDYRKEYLKSELLESTISSNPFKQFEQWAESAIKMNLYEPNAMILSTATASGRPSNRVVLLKDYSEEGF